MHLLVPLLVQLLDSLLLFLLGLLPSFRDCTILCTSFKSFLRRLPPLLGFLSGSLALNTTLIALLVSLFSCRAFSFAPLFDLLHFFEQIFAVKERTHLGIHVLSLIHI